MIEIENIFFTVNEEIEYLGTAFLVSLCRSCWSQLLQFGRELCNPIILFCYYLLHTPHSLWQVAALLLGGSFLPILKLHPTLLPSFLQWGRPGYNHISHGIIPTISFINLYMILVEMGGRIWFGC